MQIIRTAIWVLLLVALLLFSIANWDPTVTVRIWDGIVVDTKIPAIVIVSFLIGFVPMWLYHRGSKWKTSRKIASLENAARLGATTPVAASSTAATTNETPATAPAAEPASPLQPTYSDSTLAEPAPTTNLDKGPHNA